MGETSLGQQLVVHELQSAEQREVAALQDLFGGDRGSTIPVGLYVKFEVSRENRYKAALARLQRTERDRIRQEKVQLLHETTQERRAHPAAKGLCRLCQFRTVR